MPRVPVKRYGDQQVEAQAIPGVRVSPQSDIEAFGGGDSLNQVNRAASGLTDTAMDFAIKAQQQADDVKIQEADLQYGMLQNRIESEVRKMGGSNAAGAKEFSDVEWNTGLEKINSELKMSPRQSAAARAKLNARYLQINDTVNRHMAVEFEKHDKITMESKIENARNDAAANIGNPERMQAAFAQQEEAFLGWADRNGLDDEAVKKGLFDIKAETHASVVESYISNSDFNGARAYYKQNKKNLPSDLQEKFSDYIDSQERQKKELIKYQKEQEYDKNLHEMLVADTEGNLSFSEMYRRWRNDEISDADYKAMEKRMRDPEEIKYTRIDAGASEDQEVFNRIRDAQLSGKYTQGQIDRMIISEKALGKADRDYLLKQRISESNNPKDQRIAFQAKSVEDFASRYLSKSFFDFKGNKKAADVQGIVAEFYRRVDKENPNEEGIDKIANDIILEKVKKDYPEISRLDDVPHIVVGVDGKLKKLFNSDSKRQVKAQYTITRNKIEESKKK